MSEEEAEVAPDVGEEVGGGVGVVLLLGDEPVGQVAERQRCCSPLFPFVCSCK